MALKRVNLRTILFVPYRGGRGFAVLDVTNPKKAANGGDGSGPLFMYSVFNDVQNNKDKVDHQAMLQNMVILIVTF